VRQDCTETRELLTWYASGGLAPSEQGTVLAHLGACEACRLELAEALRVARAVRSTVRQIPGPPRRALAHVLANTEGVPIAEIEMGSSLAGVSLGMSAGERGLPIRGRLRLLGREVEIFRVSRSLSAAV